MSELKSENYQINAKICHLVERYPCMYDRSNPHYLKKDVVDKAWIKIAKEMDDSIPSCKERWRNIRTSFARSINVNKVPASANRTKPYYLHEELQFLARHITPGIPVSRRWNSSCYSNGEESEMIEVAVGEESFDEFAAMIQEDEDSSDRQNKADLYNKNFSGCMADANSNGGNGVGGFGCSGGSSVNDDSKAEIKKNVLKNAQKNSSQCQELQKPEIQCDVPIITANNVSNVSVAATVTVEQTPIQQTQLAPMQQRDVEVIQPTTTPICRYPPKKRQRAMEMFNPTVDDKEKDQRERERDVKPYISSTPEQNNQTDYDDIFLQGLLPEMKAMDFHQKIIFKKRIYEVITEIFNSQTAQMHNATNNNASHQAVSYQYQNLAQTAVPLPFSMHTNTSDLNANSNTNTNANATPAMGFVNAADLNMLRRLNVLLQQSTAGNNNHIINGVATTPLETPTTSNNACISSASSSSTSTSTPNTTYQTIPVQVLPKNVASISSTVRGTPSVLAACSSNTSKPNLVSVSRGGALTRSTSNFLRVRLVNTPAPIPNTTDRTTSTHMPQQQTAVKQEPFPDIMDD